MKLLINQESETPIYEQIKLQIKEQIVKGELLPGTVLPSIRILAKELKIGIITAKRAYDDLTEEGYTQSVAGKGIFVSCTDKLKLNAAGLEELKKQLSVSVRYARAHGISEEQFKQAMEEIWKK